MRPAVLTSAGYAFDCHNSPRAAAIPPAAQTYDAHASIHDDATAQKLGFKGGTIEGPTHFSQFAPLGARLWGQTWFESGCLSAHYRNACFEGEEVQAILSKPLPGTHQCQIQMVKRDGTEVLRGTASVGDAQAPTALSRFNGIPSCGMGIVISPWG